MSCDTLARVRVHEILMREVGWAMCIIRAEVACVRHTVMFYSFCRLNSVPFCNTMATDRRRYSNCIGVDGGRNIGHMQFTVVAAVKPIGL